MKFFNREKISLEDLNYLNSILKTNLPLIDCLDLIENKNNKLLFQNIKKELDSGKDIKEVIIKYLDDDIKEFLIPLINILPFSQALDISLSYIFEYKNNKQEIIKTISYPLIVTSISILAIYFFDLYGLDTIISLLASFEVDISLFNTIRLFMRILIYLLFILLLIIGILILYFSKGNNVLYFYILISKYLPQSIFHLFYSQEFISLFSLTIKKGYKTKEAFKILKSLKNKQIISFLAFHLDNELLEGKSFNDAIKIKYLDYNLSRFIKIASLSNDFVKYLDNYTVLVKEKLKKLIKRDTLIIQLISYMLIGLIIIFIYQVLFLPMNAINNF